jgi:hypothetical protein
MRTNQLTTILADFAYQGIDIEVDLDNLFDSDQAQVITLDAPTDDDWLDFTVPGRLPVYNSGRTA